MAFEHPIAFPPHGLDGGAAGDGALPPRSALHRVWTARPAALSDFSSSAFSVLRELIVPAILFGAIWLTYRLAAGPRVGPFRLALVSLFASLGWIGVSVGFAVAVPVLWSTARIYGTLGSIVLFLMWTYLIAWILLLGGLLLAQRDGVRPA